MPYVIHHNDDDGRCAAAIAMNELIPIFAKEMVTTIEYNYSYIDWFDHIDLEKFIPNDVAIIVDLSLCSAVYSLIKLFVDHDVKVIYIDHHQATFDFIDNMTEEQKAIFGKIISFYNKDVSASMLTWVYSCMNEMEKKNPMSIKYDFTASFSHVMINVGSPAGREYRINPGIRYIDDYDVWRFSSKDTLAFHYGFGAVTDKNPKLDKLWGDIIYGMDRTIQPYIEKGHAIVEYKNNEYEHILKRGHEIEFEGFRCFVVNNTCDSFMFESIKDHYDMCIAYWYDAKIDKWHYSVRSANNSKANCCDVCKKYGGGGHDHAGGMICDELLFK